MLLQVLLLCVFPERSANKTSWDQFLTWVCFRVFVTFPLISTTTAKDHLVSNCSAALCILTCSLLFHVGIELKPVLKNFVVKLRESGHLHSESSTACLVSLKTWHVNEIYWYLVDIEESEIIVFFNARYFFPFRWQVSIILFTKPFLQRGLTKGFTIYTVKI